MFANLEQYHVMVFVKHIETYERERKGGREEECHSGKNPLEIIQYSLLVLLPGKLRLRKGE